MEENAPEDVMIENIDIGGPTLIRSSAKNHKSVLVVTDTDDYDEVIQVLKKGGDISLELRREFALKAFEYTAHYDSMITDYFSQLIDIPTREELVVEIPMNSELRYGENPHQNAEFYEVQGSELIEKLFGKSLSYNNYIDIDSALKTIHKFEKPTVAIFKHTNPCGIASHENLTTAYKQAFATDTMSPFGGIVIVNRPLDMETALEINKIFTEIIIAPEFEEGVLKRLMKKKNRRLLKYFPERIAELKDEPAIVSCLNGVLCQDFDIDRDVEADWKIVTERIPDQNEIEELKFAWKTASDGFFPFADSIETIKNLGVKAVIQPGGSRGDKEVIAACNKYGIAMIFTGMRHFRH